MWAVALGMAVFLQAGSAGASEDESAVHVDCPPDSADEGCAGDEVAFPAPAPPVVRAAAPASTTFATVSFRNDVGKKLRLVEAHFTIDGEKVPVVLTAADPGKSYVIVNGPVKPGQHLLTARLTYQGDSGVFSYMKGYKLNVRSDQLLTAPADRPVSVTVVGSENKGMTVPLEKRVVVRVENGATRK